MLLNQFEIVIPAEKLNNYLLNLQHRDGWSKAAFFRKYGFNTEESLRALLQFIIANNPVTKTSSSPHGVKYIVEGVLSPQHHVVLRTVWIVLNAENCCRFVTAYPL